MKVDRHDALNINESKILNKAWHTHAVILTLLVRMHFDVVLAGIWMISRNIFILLI
jgi:hypothetical protein